MTRDVIIAYPNETCEVALERMMRAHIRHLPVVSAGHLAGFVSFRDLVLRDVAAKEGALQMMSSAVHLTGSAAGGIPPMWKCHSCGHLAHGEAPPDRCPACAARYDQFGLLKES